MTLKPFHIAGIAVAVALLALTVFLRADTKDSTPATTPPTMTSPTSPTPTMPNEQQAAVSPGTAKDESVAAAPATTTILTLKTTMGDITLELLTKDMPVTAGNFLKLAGTDFYDGIKFHRVIDGFMIQGGDPLTKDDTLAARWGQGGPGYTIPDEFGPRYSNARGTISMANAGPNTGGSQFFINTVDNVFLDGKHPVFGRVLSGMEVVDQISKVKRNERDMPLTPVTITDMVIGEPTPSTP